MINNIFIFGDSYSTYEGFIPDGYRFYYSMEGRPNMPVTKMLPEQTWWKMFLSQTGANLVQNNSWSGSTICHTALDGSDCSKTNSFIYRYRQLKESGFFDNNQIDTLLVFGGTNDSWGASPLGSPKHSDWKEQDLYSALPAISYFAYTLSKDLPNTEIIFLINTDLKEELANAIEYSAKLYGLKSLRLKNIEKDQGHPTVNGMKSICNQLLNFVHDEKIL